MGPDASALGWSPGAGASDDTRSRGPRRAAAHLGPGQGVGQGVDKNHPAVGRRAGGRSGDRGVVGPRVPARPAKGSSAPSPALRAITCPKPRPGSRPEVPLGPDRPGKKRLARLYSGGSVLVREGEDAMRQPDSRPPLSAVYAYAATVLCLCRGAQRGAARAASGHSPRDGWTAACDGTDGAVAPLVPRSNRAVPDERRRCDDRYSVRPLARRRGIAAVGPSRHRGGAAWPI